MIMYRDLTDGTWKQCPTFLVDGGSTVQQGDDEAAAEDNAEINRLDAGRLACAAPQLSLFALGVSEDGFSQFGRFQGEANTEEGQTTTSP
jgi:hypothetical protein